MRTTKDCPVLKGFKVVQNHFTRDTVIKFFIYIKNGYKGHQRTRIVNCRNPKVKGHPYIPTLKRNG